MQRSTNAYTPSLRIASGKKKLLLRRAVLAVLAVGAVSASAACGASPAASPATTPASPTALPSQPASTPVLTTTADSTSEHDPVTYQYPTFSSLSSGFRLQLVFGSPDLRLGTNRIAFALSTDQGPVQLPIVTLDSFGQKPSGTSTPPAQSTEAKYYPFLGGSRGVYAAHLTFPRTGQWWLRVSFPTPQGTRAAMLFSVQVDKTSQILDVGDTAPASHNRTAADVSSLADLTTGSDPNPVLYQDSIATLIQKHEPFVVTFASPAFCTTPLCGPQVEVLGALAKQFSPSIAFVHVDIYENPQQIQGDLSRAIVNPIVRQWKVQTGETTYVVNGKGKIAARFQSFVSEQELASVLRSLLQSGTN